MLKTQLEFLSAYIFYTYVYYNIPMPNIKRVIHQER